jgi:A/G-specific adenine glycosylase
MYKETHKKIQEWYHINGRHTLPWRNSSDSYKIYLSEIMLQQTQVKTVLERFYFPFLERFPTLNSLAQANEAEVLKMWQGLGYYQRARNLHKCAQLSAPTLPKTVQELQALPGIGKTTAHAIAAFAYHTKVPILDANVKRLLYRIFALVKRDEKVLWKKAEQLLDTNAPYIYNQALMDIGSSICKPKQTLCEECPFTTICLGKKNPQNYPDKKVSKKVPIKQLHYLISIDKHNKLITSKREQRLLEGLWSFPQSTQAFEKATEIGHIKHAYTHFKLEATIYLENVTTAHKKAETLTTLINLPHSKVEEKILILFKSQSDQFQSLMEHPQ